MTTTPTSTLAGQHPSTFDFNRLAEERLDDARAAVVRRHVAVCPSCRDELEALKEARLVFTRDVFPRTVDRVAARTPRRAWWARKPARQRALFVLAPVLGGALAVALVLSPGPATVAPDEIRAKGDAALTIFARHGGDTFAVDGTHNRLPAGAQLRLVVQGADLPYLLIASIDGAGARTVYFPYGGTRSGAVGSALGRFEVPGSITLDRTPGPERIFALLSRAPIEVAAVDAALRDVRAAGWDAVRSRATLPVDAAQEQSSVLIEKASDGDEPAARAP